MAADRQALALVAGDLRPARILEAHRRLARAMSVEALRRRGTMGSPARAAAFLGAAIGNAPVETVVLLLLDRERRLIRDVIIGTGTRSEALVPLREVARHLLNSGAHAIILGHNHPSGDPAPSRTDQMLTRQVASLAQALEVMLDDHVIVAGSRWTSLRAEGMI